eukprot:scaffold554191_cov36-Prasinocladus_malaysianus.AAC.1
MKDQLAEQVVGHSSSPIGGESSPPTTVSASPVNVSASPSPPAEATFPVYFTTILSDYSMDDLSSNEETDALKALYILA